VRAVARRLGEARGELLARPRHVLLAGAAAGLVAASASASLAVAAAAVAAVVAGRRPGLALGAATAVLAGAMAGDARLRALDRTELGPLTGRPIEARATLLEVPRRSRTGGRHALVRLATGAGRGERLLLRAGRRTPLPPAGVGEVLQVKGRLAPLGRRDAWLRRRGAHGILVARRVARTGARRGGVAGALDRLRARVERGVAAGLPPPLAALARGMVLGQDERLADRAREQFRDSGLAHLLAASGQNVMLLAALALPVLTWLGTSLRLRLGLLLGLIALYVPLAGGGPSILRAGVMGAAGVVATLAGRPAARWYALLLAALVTLALNPRTAGDPGWQLSFAAVAAIALLAGALRDGLASRRVPRGLAEAGALAGAATLGTAPLLALHFERLSLVSLPANVLAAPAVGPVMWLGMLAGVAGLIAPPAAALLNALAQYPLAYLAGLASAAARAPGATIAGPAAAPLVVFAACLALAVAIGIRRARRPALAAAGLIAVGAALLGAPRPLPPPPRDLVVSFLDVGQGDATLVQHGAAAMLVDAGPPDGPVLDRLRRAGVRRLDVLVVTHAQADHEGGAAAVLRRLPVGVLVDGGYGATTREHAAVMAAAARRRVRTVLPEPGQRLRAGPLELFVLWPPRAPPEEHHGEDPNRRAVVARLRDGAFELLLPADAESEVTGRLELPPAHVLKVAHHGSADPGLPRLLARVRPRVAVIEVGRHNRYGHPTAQALAALRAAVPRVYRTDRDGTVRLTVRGARIAAATGS
jgi:competence protein ComEC